MKICGIYKITSPSKKVYIGQSVHLIHRKNQYKNLYCKRQKHLYSSIKKHGWEKHKFEIICQCLPSQLNEIERYYINLYQTFDTKYGLNLTNGGRKEFKHSIEARKKMSKANKGKKLSEETKNKLREARAKQAPITEETRRKLSEAHKGRKLTKEHRQKLIESNKNRIWTEEMRIRSRKAHKGQKVTDSQRLKMSIAWIGRQRSEESKRKQGETRIKNGVAALGRHPKAKIVFDLQTGIYYACLKEATLAKNINYNTAFYNTAKAKHNKYSLIYA